MAKVLALQNTATGEVFVVTNKKLVFGKDASRCNAILSHPSAARMHFEVIADKGQVKAMDLSGHQGTFVNGQRLKDDAPTVINPGDRITYGTSVEEAFMIVESKGGHSEKLDKAAAKLVWLRTEIERIKAKEGAEGLTENQQRTLAKYENDVKSLEKSIGEQVKTQLKDSSNFNQDEESEDHAFWDGTIADDVIESQMLDLTEKKNSAAKKEVQTYETLLNKLTDLDSERKTLQTRINVMEAEERMEASNKDGDDEDELDKFMAANEKTIHASELEKSRKRLLVIDEEHRRASALADIARPALARMSAPPANPPPNPMPSSSAARPVSEVPLQTSAAAPSATPSLPTTAAPTKASQLFSRPSGQAKPPVNKFRIVQDRLTLEKRTKDDFEEKSDEEIQDTDSTWQPPTNQKGDGTTSANARFGY